MTRIGVDFGTSTTLVASDQVADRVIPLEQTTRWTPTVASVHDAGQLTVGGAAESHPEWSLIRSIKTAVYLNEHTVTRQHPDGTETALEVDKVVCKILEDVRHRTTSALGRPVTGDVSFACPANWDAPARHRLVQIAQQAGFQTSLEHVLDEPIAAGVSWIMDRFRAGLPEPEGRVVVFDYGGGTLDVAVLDISIGDRPEITVLAASGVQRAGDALDTRIAGDLLTELQPIVGERAHTPEFEALVRLAARRLKIELSSTSDATTRLPGADNADLAPVSYSRRQLETEFGPVLDEAIRLVHGTLRSAELRSRNSPDPASITQIPIESLANDVTFVLLAGGMSRVPLVATRLAAAFPNAEVTSGLSADARAEESIVRGLVEDESVVNDLNLHRPGFDFRLEFTGGGRSETHVVYPAHTALYHPQQIIRGEFDLGHRRETPAPPWAEECHIRCVTVDESALPFRIGAKQVQSIDLAVKQGVPVVTKLYADGRFLVRARGERTFRVERWPHIRSKHGAVVSLLPQRSERDLPAMLDPAGWHRVGY